MMDARGFALVTGGSSGIGWAISRLLAQQGWPLLLVSNQERELEDCRKLVEKDFGQTCRTLCINLSAADAAHEVFQFCIREGIEVEVLVNNAGFLLFSEVVAAPVERVEAIHQLHMSTPVMLCRLFGERMKERESGHILNVSSISAVMPYPGISLYGPGKTYLRYFTRAFRAEMKRYGVNVTCLIPGATATALYDPNKVNVGLAMKLGVMHTADFVARKGIDAMLDKRAECIPGGLNKLSVWLLPILPYLIIEWIYSRFNWMDKGRQALG